MASLAEMVSVKVAEAVCAVGVAESVTVTVTLLELAVVGVPVIWPVVKLMANGEGNPVADHLYGVVPPVAATVEEYAAPAMPVGRDVVVMATLFTTASVKVAEAFCAVGVLVSVTVTVTLLELAIVGVPVI
jgi:hypothetical protein